MLTAIQDRARLLVWSVALTGLAAASLALFIFTVVGTALIVVWVGLAMVMAALFGLRPLADLHRRWAAELLGAPIPSPYLPAPTGNLFTRLRSMTGEAATWRDLLWLVFNATIGLALSIGAVVEGVLDLIFWWLPKALLQRVDAEITRALLTPTDRARLAQRVEHLTESRADTVDSQASELRRIERDLHDGAQARLVSLGMSLGLAEDQLDRDPEGARQLLAEARESSTQALADLRDLVRGIHPPVLADRGLVGAVEALALSSALPVSITADVRTRLPAPVETAAYFAVAEALTNAIKHSDGSRVDITIAHTGGSLAIEVRDDGRGGASSGAGSGLRGIERRLAAFDGRLTVTSPPGGPTSVTMELPCESSSPKTSPSSATA